MVAVWKDRKREEAALLSQASAGNKEMSVTACAEVALQPVMWLQSATGAHRHTHTERHNERAEKGGRGGPPTSLIVQQVKEEGSGGWGYSDKQQLVQ